MGTATYYGKKVEVRCVRFVAGGRAADIRRHQDEQNWPWTVQSFTVAVGPELDFGHCADADCDIDPRTDTCRICQVHHGEPCGYCGGRAFHTQTCEETR